MVKKLVILGLLLQLEDMQIYKYIGLYEIAYLKKIEAIDPSNSEVYREIAVVYQKQGMMKEAVANLKKAIELDPQAIKAYVMLSDIYQNMGRPDQAASVIREVVRVKPSEPASYILLATLYTNQGKLAEALAEYQKAIELSPEPGKQHSLIGLLYLATGNQDEAMATFELLLEEDPENSNAFIGLAILHNLRKEYKKAAEYIEKAIHINDSNKLAYFIQANIYACQGQYQKAQEIFGRGTLYIPELRDKEISIGDFYQVDPHFIGSHLPLLASYMNQKWFDKVIEEGKTVLKKAPDNPLASYFVAQAYLSKNEVTEAVSYLEKTVKTAPSLYSVNKILGDIYYKKSKGRNLDQKQRNRLTRKTAAEYEIYLKRYKNDVNIHMKQGLLYEVMKNYEQAIAHYQEIIKLDPNAAIPYNQLAWIYVDTGRNFVEALAYAKKAVELSPNNGNIVDTLGWVYYKRGDYKEALQYFQKAIQLIPRHPSIHYHLALAYDKTNQKEEDLQALKTSLNISATFVNYILVYFGDKKKVYFLFFH